MYYFCFFTSNQEIKTHFTGFWFRKMMGFYDDTAPLGRGVTIEEVGNAAAFLCSDLASGITGEITYVDGGFNTVGISPRHADL